MDDDTGKLVKNLFAAVEEKNGGKLTPDQISRVSLKLGEMLGNPDSHEVTQNEKGQLLNEEGLPIIEISEQVVPGQASSSGSAPPLSVDLPLWTLSEDEKARRRAERERVLDMLEEEERLEAEQEAAEEEESHAAKKKRLEAARELQKAMGRALLKNVNDFKAKEEKEKSALLEIDTKACAEKSGRLKPKKSVSFDLPPEESPISAGPEQDWGDVTPARLQPKQPSTPVAHGPMKFQVVERFPRKLQLEQSPKDSDDESDPEPVPDDDEDGEPTPTRANYIEFHSDESTEDGGDFEFDEGETDLDAAQHQREIALAYYEKREKFVTQAAAVFSSHSHIEEDPWDQPEVPLNASLTGERPKPAISKFKADRIVSSSASLDGFVVPASQSVLMQDTVKLGKLEGGQLLGGSEDSDDDLKEIMDLIRQGEVENVGPNLLDGSPSQTAGQGVLSLPPPKVRNKTSRFKINRGGATQPAERTAENTPSLSVELPTPVTSNVTERRGSLRLELNQRARSPSLSPIPDTPLTIVERSSPKLLPEDVPIPTESPPSTPVSRKPAGSSQSTTSTVCELTPVPGIVCEGTPTPSKTPLPAVIDSPSFTSLPSTIIDSPSFAPPNIVFPSMIVDSPSFAPPHGVASMPPMIIDSPDFPPPKGVSSTHAYTSANPPAPLVIDSPSFPAGPKNTGPPRVMSSRVVERSPAGANQQRGGAPGKVSRFAAERR